MNNGNKTNNMGYTNNNMGYNNYNVQDVNSYSLQNNKNGVK